MFAVQARGRHFVAPVVVLAILLGLVATPFLVAPARAAGTSYYVDSVNGSDSNSGTSSSSPWRSMGPLNTRSFSAGDTINLARGATWTGGGNGTATLTINGAGAAGSPITVQAYGSGNPPVISNPAAVNQPAQGITVNAAYVTIRDLKFQNIREAGILMRGNNFVITNNEMVNTGAGIEPLSQYGTITNNYIHDGLIVMDDGAGNSWGANGIMINGGGNLEIAYNRFVNCAAPASMGGGIDGGAVEFFENVSNVNIHHNYANNTNGFTEVGSSGSAVSTNVTWAYNVMVNVGTAVGVHLGDVWATKISGYRVVNNTIVNLTTVQGAFFFVFGGGMPAGWSAGNVILRNNIFYSTAQTGFDLNPEVPITHDHNLYFGIPYYMIPLDSTEKQADPKFVNAGGGDYNLQTGSPALGSGMWISLNATCNGKPMPKNSRVDMGAPRC